MIRVPIVELTFGWEHKKPPHPGGKCVIKHKGRVVKRGSYDEMFALLDDIVNNNDESTVAVQYEETTNATTRDQERVAAPADTGGPAK